MKKKILIVIAAMIMVLSACVNSKGNGNAKDQVTIGIVQLIEHEALDNARKGFEDRMRELNPNVKIEYKNAQGEITTARTITEKFVKDGVDLIYAIATPAAQAAAAITKDVPILFSAVTDAEQAGLVESNKKPGANVTGTSDLVDIKGQLSLVKEINPRAKRVGVIFSADEQNSFIQVEQLKKASAELGLEIVDKSIQNISDLPQTAESLSKDIDAFYLLSDNKIASSISLLTDIANKNSIPTICAEEAHVKAGGLISQGISYYKLGQQTADMANKILTDGLKTGDMAVENSKEVTKIINGKTVETIGLDKTLNVFKDAKDVNIEENK